MSKFEDDNTPKAFIIIKSNMNLKQKANPMKPNTFAHKLGSVHVGFIK
jgi:hypothetical protein